MKKLKSDLSKKITEQSLRWQMDETVEYIKISTKKGYLLGMCSEVNNKFTIAYIYRDDRFKDIKDIEFINNNIYLVGEEYSEIPNVNEALEFMLSIANFGDKDPEDFLEGFVFEYNTIV